MDRAPSRRGIESSTVVFMVALMAVLITAGLVLAPTQQTTAGAGEQGQETQGGAFGNIMELITGSSGDGSDGATDGGDGDDGTDGTDGGDGTDGDDGGDVSCSVRLRDMNGDWHEFGEGFSADVPNDRLLLEVDSLPDGCSVWFYQTESPPQRRFGNAEDAYQMDYYGDCDPGPGCQWHRFNADGDEGGGAPVSAVYVAPTDETSGDGEDSGDTGAAVSLFQLNGYGGTEKTVGNIGDLRDENFNNKASSVRWSEEGVVVLWSSPTTTGDRMRIAGDSKSIHMGDATTSVDVDQGCKVRLWVDENKGGGYVTCGPNQCETKSGKTGPASNLKDVSFSALESWENKASSAHVWDPGSTVSGICTATLNNKPDMGGNKQVVLAEGVTTKLGMGNSVTSVELVPDPGEASSPSGDGDGADSPDPSSSVKVFANNDYGGTSKLIAEDKPDLTEINWNDGIISVKFKEDDFWDGDIVELWQDTEYSGHKVRLYKSTDSLNMGDSVTSVEVKDGCRVTLYVGKNKNGGHVKCGWKKNGADWCTTKSGKTGPASNLKDVSFSALESWENKASSAHVWDKNGNTDDLCWAKLNNKPDFNGGRTIWLAEGVTTRLGFNDRTSSIKLIEDSQWS